MSVACTTLHVKGGHGGGNRLYWGLDHRDHCDEVEVPILGRAQGGIYEVEVG